MVFTTQIFLFVFLPLCLALYALSEFAERAGRFGAFVQRIRLKDLVLIGASFGFYVWAGVQDGIALLGYVLLVWMFGRLIAARRSKGRFVFLFSAALVLSILLVYKCVNPAVSFLNSHFGTGFEPLSLIAPLGLSFLSFSALSYLTDVKRGDAPAGSLIDCALYLTFFAKIVSGPIVLWKEFNPQIKARRMSVSGFSAGISRLMIGFAKKLILADTFGAVLQDIGMGWDSVTVWVSMLLYMLQLYYDFSGYSDIALGLAEIFGFSCRENFRFPYRSLSITEFWRRWHVSLGTWFKEYVYIPLGGNRRGKWRTLLNLGIVFLLTGLWHGIGKAYLLWGLINAVLMIVERLIADTKFYKAIPKAVRYGGTMLAVLCFWQLFRYPDLGDLAEYVVRCFTYIPSSAVSYNWRYFLDARMIVLIIIAILGATVLGSPRLIMWWKKFTAKPVGAVIEKTGILILFVLAVLFMVNSSYSPFLYFRY